MDSSAANQFSKQTSERVERVYAFASRVFVWGLFFGTLYLLRSFFLLIFLTFVFSYIQAHGEHRLEQRIPNRTLRVVLVGILFLCTLIAVGLFVVPRVVDQAKLFADRHNEYFAALDSRLLDLGERYSMVQQLLDDLDLPNGESAAAAAPAPSPSLALLQRLLGLGAAYEPRENIQQIVELTRNIGAPLLAIGSAFMLSLLFSFLIILDLPRLRQSVQSLEYTKLGFIYSEVAGSIRDFAAVLGRAFEAQLVIALANTFLTAGVIWVLGLQKSIAFLCLIVFFCSFIPVAGVFISSIPICLLALQKSGFTGVFMAVALIWIIHIIEAYVLNPRIFGDKLKINPVLVLIILTVAGKLFHVWGLLLSLPIYTYVFGHAIKEKELESASEVPDPVG